MPLPRSPRRTSRPASVTAATDHEIYQNALGNADLQAARTVLSVLLREYMAAGKSGRELDQIINDEIEGAVFSLDLSGAQKNVLSIELLQAQLARRGQLPSVEGGDLPGPGA